MKVCGFRCLGCWWGGGGGVGRFSRGLHLDVNIRYIASPCLYSFMRPLMSEGHSPQTILEAVAAIKAYLINSDIYIILF